MFFKNIVGQDTIKQYLRRLVHEDRVPHALMLHGDEGTGAFPLAVALARYVCCLNRGEEDACGKCSSCVKFDKLVHPDLHWVFPFAKDKKRAVCDDLIQEWREFVLKEPYFTVNSWLDAIGCEKKQGTIYVAESAEIIRKLSFKTYESDYKVMIIYLPEKMQPECANALLKLLEEPTEQTFFLMVSAAPEQVLGTIYSRSQLLRIPPIEIDILARKLEERFGVESQNALSMAHLSGGNFFYLLQQMNHADEINELFQQFVSLMRLSYQRDIKNLKRWSESMEALGREKLKIFFQYAQHLLRENFIANLKQKELNYMNNAEEAFSLRFSPFIHERNVQELTDELSSAEEQIANNANGKIVLFDLTLRIATLLKRK